ncbi:MAG: phosphotransferase family protein [Burkholderiales bacterium]
MTLPLQNEIEAGLGRHVQAQTGRPCQVRLVRRYTAGFSWTTYGITLDNGTGPAQEAILRLGEPAGLLAPYTTGPESQVLRALQGSGVPVADVLWSSDDAAVIGAPFLVLSKMPGEVRIPFARRQDKAAPPSKSPMADPFVRTLVDIHAWDWQRHDLPALERVSAAGAAHAQLANWQRRIDISESRRLPLLHYALGWLHDHAPASNTVCLVHGDYRSGNYLEQDGRITAVLDWEMVHLGDPHEDLGWACLRMVQGGTGLICGLLSREDLYAQYEALSGRRVNRFAVKYYEVLSLVKIVAMNLWATDCFEAGRSTDLRMGTLSFGVPQVLREVLDVLERDE